MNKFRILTIAVMVVCFCAVAFGQGRGTRTYTADLAPLNNSGATATATFTITDNKLLTVTISGSGFEPNMVHPQHIHGFLDDSKSVCPPASADQDGDSYVEVAEGLPFYGQILLPLTPFPTADSNGNISFSHTYTLGDDGVPTFETLNPLKNRAIVLHGLTLPANAGAGTNNEVNGMVDEGEVMVSESETYVTMLPVACSTIKMEKSIKGNGNNNGNGNGKRNK